MEPFKNEFNKSFTQKLGALLKQHDHTFDLKKFESSIFNEHWEKRELKDRMRHISVMIFENTSLEYLAQLKIMVLIADQFSGLPSMTFPDYVEVHGLDFIEESLDALEHFTKFSSSEFAIRPFIKQNEKLAMTRMLTWSKNSSEHVRRLSSEGCRPRLPWAMALPSFKNDPNLVVEILENLRSDDSLYVRKSVANNLNDITKDNPALALNLAEKWYGQNELTNWIVKHGLRTLLKKGNERALQIIGFDFNAKFSVMDLSLSKTKPRIGESFNFSFEVQNLEAKKVTAKIGFVVSYMKSNGKQSDKIFHISEAEFESKKPKKYNKKLSFKDLSTRKHYPGNHQISVVVNGFDLAKKEFELLEFQDSQKN
ncbi:MAG: DNA alkylation repair protein [Reichenbachiella sp.]